MDRKKENIIVAEALEKDPSKDSQMIERKKAMQEPLYLLRYE